MGEMDAVGDAITGGLIGRAVEPRAGQGDGHTHETSCLNCGAELAGPFCQQCGQHAHVHRTLGAFFHDFLHGVLHFEGKIWRTLPLLVWRPGELTRRYIDGQRASFVSPIALFLFSVFLMFAVLSWTGAASPNFHGKTDLLEQQKEAEAELIRLQEKREKYVSTGRDTASVDEDIADTKESIGLLKTMREKGVTSAVLRKDTAVNTDLPWLKTAIEKAKDNPDLLVYKLKSNSYKWSWALIPLSIPFVWLLFPFSRRFRLYDHTVFVTYSLSFMTVLVSFGFVISAIGLGAIAPFLFFVPPLHMYRQLRGAYGVGRWGALWRTTVLMVICAVVLTAFTLLMFTLGAFD